MNAIVFRGDALEDLRRTLLTSSPTESAAVLFAGIAQTLSGIRLLVREALIASEDAYQERSRDRLTLAPVFLANAMKRARLAGEAIILVHSHPGSDFPAFSHIDDECERLLMPVFSDRVPSVPHATMVIGRVGQAARLYRTSDRHEVVDTIRSVAAIIHDTVGHTAHHSPAIYDRNVRAFGAAGQALLARFHVGIVGLGGLGSVVAQQLAHLGVGRFTLIDYDTVDETNLNRLVGARSEDIGEAKVDVAERFVHRINPSAKVKGVKGNVVRRVDGIELLACDFIFCCTDSHGSRAILNHLALAYYIPMIDGGVVIAADEGNVFDITGRVQMIAPGLPCLICHNLLDAEQVRRDLLTDEERKRDPYIVGAHIPQPAVISLNTTVGSLGVSMFLGATVGMPLESRHQIYRAMPGVVRNITSEPASDCIACSSRGVLGRGDAAMPPWRTQ